MKTRIILILTAIVTMTSCIEENANPTELEIDTAKTLYACIEQEKEVSKTYIDASLDVCWQKGDMITVFDHNRNPIKYLIEDNAEGKTSGRFHPVSSSSEEITNTIVAVYPYSNTLKISFDNSGTLATIEGISIPSVQKYNSGHTISQHSLPMAAFSHKSNQTVNFKNCCGILDIQLKGKEKISKITLKGTYHETISGEGILNLAEENFPIIKMNPDGEKEMILDCGKDGISLDSEVPTSFMFILPPTIFHHGFELQITDSDNQTMTVKTPKRKEIQRSKISRMAPITFKPDFPFTEKRTFSANGVSFNMIGIKGGSFMMGATTEQLPEASQNEFPVHEVNLKNYYIGQYEVTQELWQAVMGNNPSANSSNPMNPVENISWDNIINEFIPKLNSLTNKTFGLPTEAQWEYAARGGQKSGNHKYSGSDNINDIAWYKNNSSGKSHPVGKKNPNESGLYDMSGNVHEFCADTYAPYPDTGKGIQNDVANKIFRGGNFYTDARYCRNSIRYYERSNYASNEIGFRLALLSEYRPSISTKISLEVRAAKCTTAVSYSINHPEENETIRATANTDWIKVIKIDGDKILISIDENTTDFPRESRVKLNYHNAEPREFIIRQEAGIKSYRYFTVNGVKFTMIGVNGSTFRMGDDHGENNQKPSHNVTLSNYFIGKFEVTQELWNAVVGNDFPSEHPGDLYPVENICEYDIFNVFLPKLNKLTGETFTLPTEAQWEYAAMGGCRHRGKEFSGSDNMEEVGWVATNSDNMTHQVGTKLKNEIGLYDMTGNVWEICSDYYGSYSSADQIDPTGPITGSFRIARGGSFSNKSNVKTRAGAADYANNMGFRLVLNVESGK